MTKKLRVLFDAGVLARKQTGVGFFVEHLVRTLATNYTAELELVGYYLEPLGKTAIPPTIPNVTYKPIRWFPRQLLLLARLLGFQPPLRLLIPEWRKFDVVLYPNFVGLPTPPKLPNAVFIYDLCFVDHPEFVENLNARFLQRFVPSSVARAHKTLTDSQFIKDRLVDAFHVSPNKVAVVYSGLAVGEPQKRVAKATTKPIVCVGTIEPRKNLENLLLAYSQLPANLQKQHPLILAGSKGWKDEGIFKTYEKLKAQGLPIDYRGYVSDEEKAELYASAAAVAIVSHYEGFGMQILEAMRFDVPLLLSDIPVFHEVAGSAAAYCDKDDPASICRGLANVLEHFDKRKLAQYDKILQSFTWDKSAAVAMESFRQLAKDKEDL